MNEAKNLNNEMKSAAVKNSANSKKFYAAMLNGNHMSSEDLTANVNNVNANLNINAEVANCEISETDTSHLKLSISLPWGGEAKLEWNGSTQVASSVLAKEKCAEIARREQEQAFGDMKNSIEYIIGRTVKFFQDDMPQIRDAVKALEDEEEETPEQLSIEERVKMEYYDLDYDWRSDYERYVRNQELDLEHEECERFAAEQIGLAKMGVLNEIQLHLLDKAGILHKGTDPSNPDPIDEPINTEDEYGFSAVK